MTRLARSTTAASSSLRRWFRSSWNSRRLRCRSRSCSTSSRWRRLLSASDSVGASFSSLSAAAFRRARSSLSSRSRLAELGLELGLRRLGRGGLAQHALAVDVADLQFLRGHGGGRGQRDSAAAASSLDGEGLHQNAVPIWNWKLLDSIVALHAHRHAPAQLQRAHRRDPGQADARRRTQRVEGRPSRPRATRCRRRRSRRRAACGRCRCPGTGKYSSVLRLSRRAPPM